MNECIPQCYIHCTYVTVRNFEVERGRFKWNRADVTELVGAMDILKNMYVVNFMSTLANFWFVLSGPCAKLALTYSEFRI